MDEQQRDIYNRFGKESLAFDPRLDELKLLSSVAVAYLFWAVCIFVYTIPVAARASRTWLTIIAIACLILEVTLCLTETSLPGWMPATMTEQELVRKVHSVFPAFIAGLASLATSLYVDIDKTCIAALAELTQHQKALSGVLHQLQVVVSAAGDKNKPADSLSVEQISAKMAELREIMDQSGETTVQVVEKLKNSSSNPGSSYYWLIFLVIYGGVYLFQ
jgi:hypothetical protein